MPPSDQTLLDVTLQPVGLEPALFEFASGLVKTLAVSIDVQNLKVYKCVHQFYMRSRRRHTSPKTLSLLVLWRPAHGLEVIKLSCAAREALRYLKRIF